MAKFSVENKRAEINLIKPSLIKLPSFTGRHTRSAESIQARKEDMQNRGQMQPVGVRKLDGGSPELVFGFTRHAAGLILENENPEFLLSCVTLTADDAKEYALMTIEENINRTELSDLDLAFDQEELRIVHGMKNKEISEVFRCDPAKVTRLSKLLKLSHSVQQAVHAGHMATAAAIEMVELTHDEQDVMLQKGITKLTDVIEAIRKQKEAKNAASLAAQIRADEAKREEERIAKNLGNTDAMVDVVNDLAPVATPVMVATPELPATTDESVPVAAALDFGKLNGDAAPPKPNAMQRQRTLQQVKTVLGYYVTEDTNIVLRTFAASLLAFVSGDIGEVALEDIVRKIEGKPEFKPKS